MAYKRGIVTATGTGTKTLPTSFTPTGYRVTVGPSSGGPDGFLRRCNGGYDGTNQTCTWMFADNTIQDNDMINNKVITTKYNNGGTLADDMVASHSSLGATGAVINITTLNSSFPIEYEAWN